MEVPVEGVRAGRSKVSVAMFLRSEGVLALVGFMISYNTRMIDPSCGVHDFGSKLREAYSYCMGGR